MIYFLSIIFVFCTIVFVHELGHYLAARSVGIRVEKFYLGFDFFGLGIKKKIGETEYGLGAFPFGGYVKVSGIIDESMDDNTIGADYEYLSKNSLQQLWFTSAGVIMNILLSIFLFTIIFLKLGISEPSKTTIIGGLIDNYPAKDAGLLIGDEIKSINNIKINTWSQMTEQIHTNPNNKIFIVWNRKGNIISDSLLVKSEKNIKNGKYIEQGMIGIIPLYGKSQSIGLFNAFQLGISKTLEWLNLTYQSFLIILNGDASLKEIGGPVLIAKMAGESAKTGFISLLGMMAIISINLAFINILPIPGLDGGHALIAIIEGIIRRKLHPKIKMGFQQIGMLFLFSIFIVVIFNDILRLF